LSHRDVAYQGEQAKFVYSPARVGTAFTKERLGGVCFFNFCADGETLLTKNIDEYMKAVVEQGHYIEIVTNMTITPVIERILAWDKDLLKRVEFKCSFHYLELIRKDLLETFAANVNKAWQAGASASVELVPTDELIPKINELKEFSIQHFGAFPQLTIARNDATKNIELLTELPIDDYLEIWEQFDSSFWRFKYSIFMEKRTEYCYSGQFALFVNLATGITGQCYIGNYRQNIFKDLKKPIKLLPIGKCKQPHCYNGHALLTMGCIPKEFTDVRFGTDIRDRVRQDGTHWLNDEMRSFLDGRVDENNPLPVGATIKNSIANTAWSAVSVAQKGYNAIRKSGRL
jgi:hypothetical protein